MQLHEAPYNSLQLNHHMHRRNRLKGLSALPCSPNTWRSDQNSALHYQGDMRLIVQIHIVMRLCLMAPSTRSMPDDVYSLHELAEFTLETL